MLISCRPQDNISAEAPQEETNQRSLLIDIHEDEVPGQICIKIAKSQVEKLDFHKDGDVVLHSVPSQLGVALNRIGTRKMTPLFPIDERFEERMRRLGLDQWYIVELDEAQPLGETMEVLQSVDDIIEVEKNYKTYLPSVSPTVLSAPSVLQATGSNDYMFDDPHLSKQWHYHNTGELKDFSPGADINLLKAWAHETGKPQVIVAVTDGGIDTGHEDLIDNLWVNTNEIPNNGIDDDNNGYVDDIHGANFIHMDGKIYPDYRSHGTHVAGTVAARTNNGIGVAGVAGGDGSPDSGVRLMSCQKFGREGEFGTVIQGSQAFVYAANNGAVISQNSWAKDIKSPAFLPKYEKEAIDYFIDYAGCDNQGNQLGSSPMKGGIVIFAAGNDGKEHETYPSAYNRVVAVSSMAPNWTKAFYSNYGDWVDIMAPGGDNRFKDGQVYSTLAKSATSYKYGYMQGTSMACPHVSGVAALIVSKFGKKGFTNEELKSRLLGSLRPMNINLINPDYIDKIGVGYIDAGEVFAENKNIAPDEIKRVAAAPEFVHINLQWTAVEDKDDKMPVYYNIYMDEQELTAKNYTAAKRRAQVKAFGMKPGTEASHRFDNLSDNKNYYFAIEAIDRWGLKSPVTFAQTKTKRNNAPIIEGIPDKKIRITGTDRAKFTLSIKDVDGHKVFTKISGDKKGVSYSEDNNKIHFVIIATAPVGQYKIKIEGRDEIGAVAEIEIPFEIYTYQPPVFKETIKPQIVGITQGEKVIDLSAILEKDPNQKVSYQASSSDGSVLSVKVDESGKLRLIGQKNGTSKVNIVVTDGVSKPATMSFEARVVSDMNAIVYTMYPVPVERHLNVIVNPEMAKTTFEVISMLGRTVYKRSYDINGQNNVTLSLVELTPGSYTLKVSSDKGTYQKNFVKI